MGIKIMPVSDLRRKTKDVIDAIQSQGDAVYITQHGRPVVVLVEYEHYEQLLEQLQDLSDQVSLQAAASEPARPYSEFAAEMGLPTEPVAAEN
jgi:prevent-host-death family protein